LNPKQNSADKAPAVKTVDYLKQLMMKIESQEFKMDLREKLKKNLSLFASGMVPFGSISNDDEASTSGINKDNNDSDGKEVTRKRKASEGFVFNEILGFFRGLKGLFVFYKKYRIFSKIRS
jgi:hypothetical protein